MNRATLTISGHEDTGIRAVYFGVTGLTARDVSFEYVENAAAPSAFGLLALVRVEAADSMQFSAEINNSDVWHGTYLYGGRNGWAEVTVTAPAAGVHTYRIVNTTTNTACYLDGVEQWSYARGVGNTGPMTSLYFEFGLGSGSVHTMPASGVIGTFIVQNLTIDGVAFDFATVTATEGADTSFQADNIPTAPSVVPPQLPPRKQAWLLDRDRNTILALPDFYSLITHRRFGDHSTWTGRFPARYYDAFDAAYFVLVADEAELYLVEQVELGKDEAGTEYTTAGGGSATRMLHQRTLEGEFRWDNIPAGTVISDIIAGFSEAIAPVTASIHRFYNKTTGDHLLTATASEGFGNAAYSYESVAWVWEPAHNAVPVYRAYNTTTRQHFYTTSTAERDSLTTPWRQEGVGFYASATGTAVYRLVRGTKHMWTTSTTERDSFVAGGWTSEGIGFYIATLVETPSVRGIPGLGFGDGSGFGDPISMQRSWGDAGDTVLETLAAGTMGMSCHLSGTDIILDVFGPTDSTALVGDKYGNAAASKLGKDISAWKNYAIVLGEGEGAARVRVDVDWTNGEERRELYVDARDLAKTVDGVTLTDPQYAAVLTQRGEEKLADVRKVEYAEADTTAPLSVGDIVWYDTNRFRASLMVSEASTTREGGTVKHACLLGEPPATLRKAIRRM